MTYSERRLVRIIRSLSIELAVSLEHYAEDETQWFPEAVEAVRQGAAVLDNYDIAIPIPVSFVLVRGNKVAGAGSGVLTSTEASRRSGLTTAILVKLARSGQVPGAYRSGRRWMFDTNQLAKMGLVTLLSDESDADGGPLPSESANDG
jgi:hypothetical protein